MRFRDRRDAGQRLAITLAEHDLDEPIVLALPRGGVPVAYEVASALGALLDVFVARKVGAPGHPEYGIGAIAEGSDRLVTTEAAAVFDLSDAELQSMVDVEQREIDRRIERYRPGRSLPNLEGRDLVVVDDGLATGVTAEAALRALADRTPRRLVLAVPVGAIDSRERLSELAEVVCLSTPDNFRAVGVWYDDFVQVTDAEVVRLIESAAHPGYPCSPSNT